MNIGDKVIILASGQQGLIAAEVPGWHNGRVWDVAFAGGLVAIREENLARVPEFGMGCSMGYGSDSYPFHITGIIKSGKSFTMRRAKVGKNRKVWPEQDYEVEFDANGAARTVRLSKKRGWVCNGQRVLVGAAIFYQDPSF